VWGAMVRGPKRAPAIGFAEAVAAAKVSIERALAPENVARFGDAARSLGPEALRRNSTLLLSLARRTSAHFDMLRLGVADALERGETLPPEVLDWLERFLRCEEAPPPKKMGRPREAFLHVIICFAVKALNEAGLSVARRPDAPPLSACDAVAQAMAELGRTPCTFSGVRDVWDKVGGSLQPVV
jgi:hypothetical protein